MVDEKGVYILTGHEQIVIKEEEVPAGTCVTTTYLVQGRKVREDIEIKVSIEAAIIMNLSAGVVRWQ